MNRVQIIGNVGKEPELKTTSQGKPFLKFSVAVNEKYEDRETTTWFPVTVWGKYSEILAQRLRSGSRVMVEGKLRVSSYVDANEVKKTSFDLQATTVHEIKTNSSSDRDPSDNSSDE